MLSFRKELEDITKSMTPKMDMKPQGPKATPFSKEELELAAKQVDQLLLKAKIKPANTPELQKMHKMLLLMKLTLNKLQKNNPSKVQEFQKIEKMFLQLMNSKSPEQSKQLCSDIAKELMKLKPRGSRSKEDESLLDELQNLTKKLGDNPNDKDIKKDTAKFLQDALTQFLRELFGGIDPRVTGGIQVDVPFIIDNEMGLSSQNPYGTMDAMKQFEMMAFAEQDLEEALGVLPAQTEAVKHAAPGSQAEQAAHALGEEPAPAAAPAPASATHSPFGRPGKTPTLTPPK